ncbi:hypothetical protein [Photobacterium minamisatsumaniensis]|uniref:hypothetical protein n=1 Tax=Photobacterium minamisatsumaniensis TaxID=2910233 RepID=UPI003D11FD4F
MAAEKLTKGRLIQILFLMAVLITAFVWRTVTYDNSISETTTAITCTLSADGCLDSEGKKVMDIALTPYPAKAESELILQINNTDVKPSATVEGVDMYMGLIPVLFNKTASGWAGEFTVPDCIHDEMNWNITIKQGDTSIIASFVVKK